MYYRNILSYGKSALDYLLHMPRGTKIGNGFTNLAMMGYNSLSPETRAVIPGMNIAQNIDDTQRYWADYKKNTGKSPRYPGVQIHSRDFGDAVSTAKSLDWWL